MEQLKVQCAWCGVTVREGKLPVTHGACRSCADKMLAQMEKEKPNVAA